MTQSDEARARRLLYALNLWSARADTYDEKLESAHDVAALTAAFAEVRRQQAERDARLVEKHAHGVAHGVFMRMAERIRSLAPEPPDPEVRRGQWIPCGERMPPHDSMVLGVHPPSNNVWIYLYEDGAWHSDGGSRIRDPQFHPRVWMPLPEAPEPPDQPGAERTGGT